VFRANQTAPLKICQVLFRAWTSTNTSCTAKASPSSRLQRSNKARKIGLSCSSQPSVSAYHLALTTFHPSIPTPPHHTTPPPSPSISLPPWSGFSTFRPSTPIPPHHNSLTIFQPLHLKWSYHSSSTNHISPSPPTIISPYYPSLRPSANPFLSDFISSGFTTHPQYFCT
jgi:hypothetical protein